MILISLICFMIAARYNAVMDVLTHHFEDSIFYVEGDKENTQWYDPSISWKNKYIGYDPKNGRLKWNNTKFNYPVQITDAWHLNKTKMIIFLALSIITFPGNFSLLQLIGLFISFGFAWNIIFSLFYNHILRKDVFVI